LSKSCGVGTVNMYVTVLNYQDRTFSIVHHGLQVGIIKINAYAMLKALLLATLNICFRIHATTPHYLIPLRRTKDLRMNYNYMHPGRENLKANG